MTPTFFVGIGAQKCASTWLYDILSDHPDVTLSETKEIDFFSYHYNRGYQWYERHWQTLPTTRAFGEISPSYFCEPQVPLRLQDYAPAALIMLSLRDPVERAISNHIHEVRLGNLVGPDLSFDNGLKNNPMYVEQSRYGSHLTRWLECFPKQQILIIFMEDIVSNRQAVANRVHNFLGIRTDHESAFLTKRSNEAHVHRFSGLEQTRKGLRRLISRIGMDRAWNRAQALGFQKLYRDFNRLPPENLAPPVPIETKNRLRAILRDDIRLLEDISDRSLDHWLTEE